MIPIPGQARVWIATGHTDMRKGAASLGLLIQEGFGHKPNGGDLFVFRGRRADLVKIIWHDGLGVSLYSKRLERGKFAWPSAKDGVILISAGQLGFLLEGIDWRNPQYTFRPELVG